MLLLLYFSDVAATDEIDRNALHWVCSSKSEKSIVKAFNMIMERYVAAGTYIM